MGRIIAITNQKGGVGKTTTAVNLASSLGELKKKTLLIDFDPQGNSTSGVGVSKKDTEKSIYELLMGTAPAEDVIIKTEYSNLSLIPTGIDLAGAEIEILAMDQKESRLKMAIASLRGQYDYIIIDCPPALGQLTINALTAADTFLVPIQCEFFALEGLSQLMNTVQRIKRAYNPHLELEGVLMTMYDARLNLTQEVAAQVKKFFPRQVFKTVIPRSVRLSEASGYGQPINYFDKRNKGADAYRSLAKEVIKNKR